MHNLLLTGAFPFSEEQKEQLVRLGCSICFMQQESGELSVEASWVEMIVCNGLFLHHDIDEFANLRYVQLTSAGLDRVPLNRIRERGIVLHNARGVYGIPMAEWVMFRVLERYKQAHYFWEQQLHKNWIKHRGLREIMGCRAAIIGAGNVGKEVAKRLTAFGAKVVGYDIQRIEKNRNIVHEKEHATYTVFQSDGEKYVQLDTYGRTGRENPEKLSQSIQLDSETASFLVDILNT